MKLLLFVMFSTFLPFIPQQSFFNKAEVYLPLEIGTSVTSMANSIHLSNITMSEVGFFYSIISDKKIDLNEENLIKKFKDDKEMFLSTFVDQNTSNETLIFTNLKYNSTYFIYYFGESFMRQERSQIEVVKIMTQDKRVFVNHFGSGFSDQISTAIITILFIFSLFLFFKKLEEERILESNNEERSDFYQTPTPKENGPLFKHEVSQFHFIFFSNH